MLPWQARALVTTVSCATKGARKGASKGATKGAAGAGPCLGHHGVVDAAPALVGQHRKRASAVLQAGYVTHNQALNKLDNILALHSEGDQESKNSCEIYLW